MAMSDAEYVYRQDLREKKITSYGAFHKKRGAKSKKCNFPSDYLTKKEKKKLNSEITTYDMSKFYTYDEFKKLPPDIQVEYLNTLIKKYDITVVTVAKEVFGVTSDAIRQMLVKSNVYNSLCRRPHFRPRKEDIERFQNDIFKARMVNFAKKYSGQEVEVRIKVVPKSHICVLSE